jgi:glycosyltransferase involved in cell wall biosynthesis
MRRMRRVLATADAVVMSTPEAVRRVRESFPEFAGKRVVAIANGFDRQDFSGEVDARRDGKFRIVHAGYLHTDLGQKHRRSARMRQLLGGSVKGVDFLTRSHVHLIEAVERLIARQPSLRSTIEIDLAGVATPADRAASGDSNVVNMLGYIPHADVVRMMRTADLLFLPMHELPAGVRAGIVPGKTYEYLAAGPPILAAVPEGDARDILRQAGNARICGPSDVDAMERIIQREIERFERGGVAEPADERVVERFEYGSLAGELAAVFRAVTEADDGQNERPAA